MRYKLTSAQPKVFQHMKSTTLRIIILMIYSSSGFAYANDNNSNENNSNPSNAKQEASIADMGILIKQESNLSYLTPALEILGFEFLLNQYNRRYSGSSDYNSNLSTIRNNLTSSWKDDKDPFKTNQLGHPYQGSIYHGFARSSGLGYWESLGYTAAGSAFWEIAGEKLPPSRNDMISTSFGGSFLGEALFRMSSLMLEKGGNKSSIWRETGAAIVSPTTGFNRTAFSDRFDSIFSSNDAVYYSRFQFGVSNTVKGDPNQEVELKRNDAQLEFAIDYGMPGKPGYSYTRPFDYFTYKMTASSANVLENVMTRGLLFGEDYQVGESYRGIWGIYGSYDYISPQTFRVSSTAVSLGTTGQLWLSESIAMQGTVLAGVGYAAVGAIKGNTEQDYRYGVAPQGLAALRFVFGKKASLDFTGREYFVSDFDNIHQGGHDNIVRADTSLTYRIKGPHALSIKYQWNQRDATSPNLGDRKQTTGTLGIYYTLLGEDGLGAVDWRQD